MRTSGGASNLWRQPLDGAPATQLTSYPPGEEIAVHAWSREGTWLALVRNVSRRQVVLMRDVSGLR